MLCRLAYLFLFGALSVTYAADSTKSTERKQAMHSIYSDVSGIQKYLASEKAFSDPKNEKTIEQYLNGLKSHLQTMQDKKLFDSDPSTKSNLEMLSRHIDETNAAFSIYKKKQFARWMLNSAFNMCIACHTRVDVKTDFSFAKSKKGMFEDTFGQAEFLFATRQFDDAIAIFKKMVKGYPKNKTTNEQLRQALNNIAIYYTRVKPDANLAIQFFDPLSKEKRIPVYIKKNISDWTAGFKRWSAESNKNWSQVSNKQLLQGAKEILGKDLEYLMPGYGFDGKYYIEQLRASYLLHLLLDRPDKTDDKAEALYLLGLIYNRINHSLFFRFDEMYLRACIYDYKQTKFAHDCYHALEQIITDGYTGSAGTEIPDSVKEDLEKMKKLLGEMK